MTQTARSLSPGKTYDGPFGLDMGLSLEEARELMPGLNAAGGSQMYSAPTVPAPHTSFESYALQFSSKTGLCAIVAVGKDIESGSVGAEVKSAFAELDEALSAKYGNGKTFDFATEIMSDPQYWMLSLSEKDRTLAKYWDSEEKSNLPPNLSAVSLETRGSSLKVAYLVLRYEFANISDCETESKARKNKSL